MRIASVLPSATEIVAALGSVDELVARSAECDYPPSVRDVPILMRARTLDGDRPSAEIDRRVREARGQGESLYELDLDGLARAAPDVLFTQDLCGVCSVTEEEVARACARAGVRPRIVTLSPRTLDEVWESVATVGAAIGRRDEARALLGELRRRSTGVVPAGGPRVAVVEWLDPPILAGLWTPGILRRAGATPVGPEEGEPAALTSWAALRAEAPELTILAPCSFRVERTARELAEPRLASELRTAVGPGRGVMADEAYFSRPGPRLADGLELVRGLLAGSNGPFPYPTLRLDALSVGALP